VARCDLREGYAAPTSSSSPTMLRSTPGSREIAAAQAGYESRRCTAHRALIESFGPAAYGRRRAADGSWSAASVATREQLLRDRGWTPAAGADRLVEFIGRAPRV